MLVSCYILTVLLLLGESLGNQNGGQEVDSLQTRKSDKNIAKGYSKGESSEDAKQSENDPENPGIPKALKEAEIRENLDEPDEEMELGWIKNRNNLQEVKISDSQTDKNNKIVDKVIQSEDYEAANESLVSPTGDYIENLLDNHNKYTVQYRQPMPPVSMPSEQEVYTGMYEHDHATPEREYKEKEYEPKQCVSTLKELYTCIFCSSESTVKQHFVSCYHLLPPAVRAVSIECANRIYDLSMTVDSYGVDYFDLFCKKFKKFKETRRREDRRIVWQALVDLTLTRSTVRADVGVAIVPQTTSRHLAEVNLKSKCSFRALPLTPEHRQLRLQWFQARSMWKVTEKVVFSHESRFVFGTDHNRVRVWRSPGERYNSPHTVLRHTARTAGVMVWGAIAYDSWFTLIVMRGSVKGQRYVDDILRPHVGPFLYGLPGIIFQHDNARPHAARVVQDFLHHFPTLPLLARSPDLSPVEHVWYQLKRQMPSCHSVQDLELVVQDLWVHLPQDNIRCLTNSMPDHVAACIAAGSGPTRDRNCPVFVSLHTLYSFNCLVFEIK
ncbi:transposable element Tcb2 transposase [Trichonephila clavipes]|nr:transposable element Tcb2 transposase [Trichonephila clavipes]